MASACPCASTNANKGSVLRLIIFSIELFRRPFEVNDNNLIYHPWPEAAQRGLLFFHLLLLENVEQYFLRRKEQFSGVGILFTVHAWYWRDVFLRNKLKF